MQSELKACPFCGGEALLERGSDHHGKWFNLGCSRHWGAVADPDEGCIGGRLFYTETEKDEAEAITAWNTRASDAEITRLTEALRAAEEREKALREAFVAEREENLWNAYATGHVKGDEWTHLFMSDGEWLAKECGLDPRQGYYNAEEIRNAIPIAARNALPRKAGQ